MILRGMILRGTASCKMKPNDKPCRLGRRPIKQGPRPLLSDQDGDWKKYEHRCEKAWTRVAVAVEVREQEMTHPWVLYVQTGPHLSWPYPGLGAGPSSLYHIHVGTWSSPY